MGRGDPRPVCGDARYRVIVPEAWDERLRIRVTNPVPAAVDQQSTGHHMALDNIRQRLDAHYGDHGALELKQDDRRYEVVLEIPMQFGDTDS